VATPDPTAFAEAVHLARRGATAVRNRRSGAGQGRAPRLLGDRAGSITSNCRSGSHRGESLVVINYRNHRGDSVNEVLMFDGDLVREGHGTYLNEPLNEPLNQP
jgi:hypothetical protein